MCSLEGLVLIESLPVSQSRRIIAALEELERHPTIRADDVAQHDDRGRTHYCRSIGDCTCVFWIDHAECVVYVLDVRLG